MLQRNPKSPNELPPPVEVLQSKERQAQEATDERFQKYLKKRRRLIAISKVAMGATLFANANIAPYLADVRSNMLEADSAKPSISVLQEAPDPENNDTATVFFQGFNAYSADYFIKTIGPGYQEAFDGELWSVRYNNATLDPDQISELIQEKIEDRGVTKIKFVFYSQGSAPGTDAAVTTIADSWDAVEDITYVASPADFSSLTDKTKSELSIAKNLAWIPWIEYSTPFRLGLEAYFYRNAMEKDPMQTSEGIVTRYANGDMTSNAFLASQINSISDANVPAKIREIAQYSDSKHMPNINYIMIEDNKDSVVNNEESLRKICDAAIEAGLNCTVLSAKSRHGDYFLPESVEEYNAAFQELAEIVKPYTAQEAARHALRYYDYTQENSLPIH